MQKYYKLPLSAEQLMLKSRELSEINLIDKDAIEPLNILVKSFNEEARLYKAGAQRVQDNLLRILHNRLCMLRDFEAHPEIAEQEINAPIIISGSTRTGSTKMQRLLAASEDFNWLPYWMALNPSSYTGKPNENKAPRMADADTSVKALHDNSPNARNVHDLSIDIPEEDTFILIQSLCCGGFMGYADVPSYFQWLATQDMLKPYRFMRDMLKYLQWQGLTDPSKRWLLKSPFHCGMESFLTQVFPDACLIMTHRPPEKMMPSMCSMLQSYQMPYTNEKLNSHMLVAGLSFGLQQNIAFRENHPEFPILDINYKEVTDDVEKVAKKIYHFANQQLPEKSLQNMLKWNNNNPINKQGVHKYSLEDFGLSNKEVNQQNADYLDFYHKIFET